MRAGDGGNGRAKRLIIDAKLVAATLTRIYGKPSDGFSWKYVASSLLPSELAIVVVNALHDEPPDVHELVAALRKRQVLG